MQKNVISMCEYWLRGRLPFSSPEGALLLINPRITILSAHQKERGLRGREWPGFQFETNGGHFVVQVNKKSYELNMKI